MKHARSDYNRIQDPAGLIPNDEPVFLLRAKDEVAPLTVDKWADYAEQAGSDWPMVKAAREQAQAMRDWQWTHGCQVPDMPSADQTGSSLLPHQQRIVNEKDELQIKLNKLNAFMGTTTFFGLSEDEKFRLTMQSGIMDAYVLVLRERIRNF